MSKVRDLPETTSLDDNDVLYAVDVSAGPNGGRKITKENLKATVALSASEIKTAYESNPDTNAFTDAEKAKLATVEAGAAFQDADEVPFDNTGTGLTATEVQAAIVEVNEKASAEFRASILSGRILRVAAGNARFDGVFYSVPQTDILVDANLTNGSVYIDLDGTVKITASSVDAPPYTLIIARVTTDSTDIITLTDRRVKSAQNIIRGLLSDVRDVRAGAAAAEGTSGRISDAMHKHNILTGAPSTQTPDQANSEGSSVNLARADHVHAIATDTAVSVATANTQGSSTSFSRADHAHQGVHSVKANSGSQRHGDTSLLDGNGVTVTDDGSGNFTIDTTLGPNELKVTQGAGLTANYTGGKVRINGTTYTVAAGALSTTPNAINGRIYVDVDGLVKSTTSTSTPSGAVPLAIYSSSISAITALTDNRTLLNPNIKFGLAGDISTIQPDDAAAAGVSYDFARIDHKHAIAAAAPTSQAPDQANAEGSSTSFARADHIHNIPADAPTTTLSPATSNAEGSGVSFARNDHTHAIATALVGDISTIQPDDAAAAGTANTFSRGDHKHAIVAAAPTTTLSPATSNAEGSGTSFARNDHTHAVATALVGNITTIQPDDAAAAGTSDTYARGDHRHAIVAAAPSNTGTANSEGSSTSFARADHIHDTTLSQTSFRTQTNANTNSATDVLITSTTLTPGAGTWLVLFEGAVSCTNNTATITFSIYANAVQVTNSERAYIPTNATIICAASNAIVTVTAGQAIDVRYRTTAGTVNINGRSLNLVRLSA